MRNAESNYFAIRSKLSRLRRRQLAIQSCNGVLWFVGYGFVATATASLLEGWLHFPPAIRLPLVCLLVLMGLWLLVQKLVLPIGTQVLRPTWTPNIEQGLAREVGRYFPHVGDHLINALQVYHHLQQNREGYSPELSRLSLVTVWDKIKDLDFNSVAPWQKLQPVVRFTVIAGLVFLVSITLFSKTFNIGAMHLLHPQTSFRPQLISAWEVSPGNVEIVEGDSVRISIRVKGKYKGPILLRWRQSDKKVFQTKQLLAGPENVYSYLFANLRESVKYMLQAGEESSEMFTIHVEKRPMVRLLQAELIFPPYSGLESRYLQDNVGNVTALKGTRVRLYLKTNKTIKRGWLEFDRGKKLPLKPLGAELKGQFRLVRDDVYRIRLIDNKGYRNRNPIEYYLNVTADQKPVVRLPLPGKDVDLGEDLKLALQINAEDDFGLSRIRLGYQVQKAVQVPGVKDTTLRFIELKLPNQNTTQVQLDYLWDLSSLNLMPEDVVRYFAEVWDNDAVSGFKRARSQVFTARFPSVYEIYQEVTEAQDEDIENLKDIFTESQELKRKLDEISREMQKNPDLDWLKKQDLEEIAQKQERLQKNLEQIRRELEQAIERLEKGELLSQETLEKYQQLQQLFQEIMTPELQQAIEKLRKAFDQVDPEKLKTAVQRFNLSQENFLKSIERTTNILKRLQIEQRLDAAAKLAQNLAERQKLLNQQLEEIASQQLKELLQQQEKIREDATTLDQVLKDVKEKMGEFNDLQPAQMDSLLQQMQDILREMAQQNQGMVAGNKSTALKSGQMSQQDLEQLRQMLVNLKKNLVNDQKKQVAEAFARSAAELLRLSEEQEQLAQQVGGLSATSPKLNELAEKQLNMLNYLGKVSKQLYQLSQKSFFVTPEIGRAIGKSVSHMSSALNHLTERNPRAASNSQRLAMGGLNEAVLQIQNSMQDLAMAASAAGLEEFLRRLQKMAGQQQGINQQTIQLMGQGQMTLEQQAAMACLVAVQQALRKSLEQLQREFGKRSEILGRLDGMGRDMDEVIKDLQNKQVTRKTIERQQRILSRLLDAQHSLRQRDRSRRRQARPGKTYIVRSPDEIPPEILQQRERFQEDLLRAQKEGYAEDYLELIRRYFEALSREMENLEK
ncbi:hypothetical protein J7K19_04540 [bacterium]|nr:hypothetical protein [bacterium]